MTETGHDDFNGRIIAEFRANGGRVSQFGDRLLLLHHKGAKTGMERVNPLAFQKVGNAYAVFASKAGAPSDPQWFRNLLAHPDATAEIGTDTVRVRDRLKATVPAFADYEVKAVPRQIPVVVLEPMA